MRWIGLTTWVVAGASCGGGDISLGHTGFATGGSGAVDGTEGSSTTSSPDDDGTLDTTMATTAPFFPDVGNVPPPPDPPPDDGIPTTCPQAAMQDSTVGCLFFGADLDVYPLDQAEPWGLTVANVQADESDLVAHVIAEVLLGSEWATFEEVDLAPGELHLFLPGQAPHEASLRVQGATVRVQSDVPIIAHQFNPIAKAKATSDASMLYPVTAWDHDYVVMDRPHIGFDVIGELYPYFTIIASRNDTVVEIVPSVATRSGTGILAGTPGQPLEVTLQEGELVQIAPGSMSEGASLTGTTINSGGKPVAVFAAHRCANVPADIEYCDHLEEQMSGRHQWGRTYAAVRPMPRLVDEPEPVLWQILAADDTTIEFRAHEDVTGLPTGPAHLERGESIELMVTGSAAHPGDFVIDSEEPVAVMQYMASAGISGNWGDPSAIQLAPTDQFIERLVLLVPDKWADDHLAITRVHGADVWLDDELIDDAMFVAVGDDDELEAARITVEDGVHTLVSSEPLSAIVVGYDAYDSYGYLGGARTSTIYQPAG